MAKLSATAARVQAALTAHFAPRLANDAQLPDFTPALAGITRANLGKNKAQVWAKAKGLFPKGVLANDEAGPDDVAMRILDMIDKQGASEPEQPGAAEATQTTDEGMGGEPPAAGATQTDPNSGAPMGGKEEDETDKGAPDPEMMKMLTEKLGGDADMAKACYDICMGGAKDEVVDPAATETPATEVARDEDEEDAPMLKPAMDAAIAAAVTQSEERMRARAQAAQSARQAVRPWVGEVSVAFDSADAIYEAALKSLGVQTKGVHASAYPVILQNLPKPGSAGGRGGKDLANDAAMSRDRSSHAAKLVSRVRVMG